MEESVRAIIVEDHEITRVGLKVGLSRVGGLEVIAEIDNGKDAVRAAKSMTPDVVLMDIGLPVQSGVDATLQIKSECPSVKVLMLTSHESEEDIRGAFAAGADGYCLKDLPTHALALAIKSVAAGAVWLDPRIAKTFLEMGSLEANGNSNSRSDDEHAAAQASLPRLGKDEAGLTPRELEVLELIAQGLSNNEIAERLYVSGQTVKTHVRHIMEKMSVSDRTQAAVRAIKKGLV